MRLNLVEGMGPSDEELVEAFRRGELSAFDGLVARWERKIRGAVHRILGNEEEARDVCQEAFLKAYRALDSFKSEARFSSWLYQIALNLCRDRLRRRKGRTLVSLEELEDAGTTLVTKRPDAQELLEAGDLARTVASAIALLPEEQREIVVLKEYQELTFAEIAEVLGIPISTVKTRLYRGLGQLRVSLERQGVRGVTAVPATLP
jgi:RNA polymerase sigma-70 factor (ECF subfamily)